jgi:hypothetical protein
MRSAKATVVATLVVAVLLSVVAGESSSYSRLGAPAPGNEIQRLHGEENKLSMQVKVGEKKLDDAQRNKEGAPPKMELKIERKAEKSLTKAENQLDRVQSQEFKAFEQKEHSLDRTIKKDNQQITHLETERPKTTSLMNREQGLEGKTNSARMAKDNVLDRETELVQREQQLSSREANKHEAHWQREQKKLSKEAKMELAKANAGASKIGWAMAASAGCLVLVLVGAGQMSAQLRKLNLGLSRWDKVTQKYQMINLKGEGGEEAGGMLDENGDDEIPKCSQEEQDAAQI